MTVRCGALLLIASATTLVARRAEAEPPPKGPEVNPYECYGRYQSATGNPRGAASGALPMSQVRVDLERRLDPPYEPDEPPTIRAMKLCVIALLKSRLGDSDAADWYEKTIEENPEEPGYELWFGNYYSGFRGAHRPVLELAEKHFYRALEKLDNLRANGRYREYHAVVEEWVHKHLLVLYQEDGQPILPWKMYKQDSSGLYAPSISVSSQFSISKDTRDFYFSNEMRTFTSEANFTESDIRSGIPQGPNGTRKVLSARQVWDIARNPIRYRVEDKVRIRQNFIGAIDLIHMYEKGEKSQIRDFYWALDQDNTHLPFEDYLADVTTQQLGVGYNRVLPLYPLFDARVEASVRRIERRGVVEFLPDRLEKFNLYEFKPSLSHFLSSDKVSIDGVYALLDIQASPPGGIPDEHLRTQYIRALRLEYALYSPLMIPAFLMGTERTHRTATRGWYFYGGLMEDAQDWGTRTAIKRDYYLGTRFEGPGKYDITLQGTYYTASAQFADANSPNPVVKSDPTQASSNYRTSLIVQHRIINPDAMPGVQGSTAGFAADMLNLVIPISHDLGLTGRKDYENVRGGVELWFKLFGTGIGGTAFLLTTGYDYQYYYRISKGFHMAHAAIRMGWGDL
jgi:hypothetical protein